MRYNELMRHDISIMRSPRSVDIDITTRCNLRCAYCYHFSGPGDVGADLPASEWLKFLKKIGNAGIMDVTLQGGEPFLRPDLEEIINGIIENRMRFSILTNGTLITDAAAAYIAFTRRCNGIQISIDGSDPEIHDPLRGNGSFVNAVAGIRRLQRHGISVMVRVTIHPLNYMDLNNIAAFLLDELQLPSFSTNAACHLGAARQNSMHVGLDIQQRSAVIKTLIALDRQYPGRITGMAGPLYEARTWLAMRRSLEKSATGKKNLHGQADDFAVNGYLRGCGCVFSKIAVRADGVLVPCIMLGHMRLGRINRDDFIGIWRQHPEMEKMRQRRHIPLTRFSFCQDCEYISFCTGNCPATAFTTTGAIDFPSPDGCLKRFLEAGGRLPELDHAA